KHYIFFNPVFFNIIRVKFIGIGSVFRIPFGSVGIPYPVVYLLGYRFSYQLYRNLLKSDRGGKPVIVRTESGYFATFNRTQQDINKPLVTVIIISLINEGKVDLFMHIYFPPYPLAIDRIIFPYMFVRKRVSVFYQIPLN